MEILPAQIKVPEIPLRNVRQANMQEILEDRIPYLHQTIGYMSIEIVVRENEDLAVVVRHINGGDI